MQIEICYLINMLRLSRQIVGQGSFPSSCVLGISLCASADSINAATKKQQ